MLMAGERRSGGLFAAAMLGALLAAGCGEQQAPEGRNAVNVALLIPSGGDLSSYGRECRRGAEVAWAQIGDARRDAGDSRLFLNIRDDHGDTKIALRTARQLFDVAKYLVLIGPMTNETAPLVATEMQERGVSLIVPTVDEEGLLRGRPNVVQLCLTSSSQGRLLARFVLEALKPAAASAVVVRPEGDREARALADGFSAEMRLRSPSFGLYECAVTDKDETGPVLSAVQGQRPGVVLAPLGPDELRAVVTRLRSAGETVPVVGAAYSYATRFLDEAPRPLGPVYVAAHFAPDDPRPAVVDFVNAYRRANKGETPSATAALCYDAMQLADLALRRAPRPRGGMPAPEDVGRTLKGGLALPDAVTGPLTVNADGSTEKPLTILAVDEAGPRFYNRVGP
jgi:ABC-type branched-subunit amino acid transport system substrate-binding protein